jgi:hypothetical protein
VKREEVVDPIVTERWKKLPFNNYRIPRKSDLKQQGSAQKSPDSDSQLDTNGHVARTPEHIPDPPVSISRTPEIPSMPKKRRRSRFEPISPEITKLVETLESPKLVEPPHVERPHQYLKNNNNGPQKIIHVYAGANAFAPPFIPPPTMYPFSGPFSHWALNVAALGQQQCESDLDSILIPPPPPPPLS